LSSPSLKLIEHWLKASDWELRQVDFLLVEKATTAVYLYGDLAVRVMSHGLWTVVEKAKPERIGRKPMQDPLRKSLNRCAWVKKGRIRIQNARLGLKSRQRALTGETA
jgi:hypothetical protein